jgi:hypothetical protein
MGSGTALRPLMVKLDVMERNEPIKIIAPPRAIHSVIAGVNHIEKKPYLILLPVILDLFLWLGPNLSMKNWVENLVNRLSLNALLVGETAALDTQPLIDLFRQISSFGATYNVLSLLSTFPLGIPAILKNADTLQNPFGLVTIIESTSLLSLLSWSVLLLFTGLVLGCVYLFILSENIADDRKRSFPNICLQAILYSIALSAVLFIGGLIPIAIGSMVAIISPAFGQFVLLLLLMVVFWLLLPAFYGIIPIFLFNHNFTQAVASAYRTMGLRYKVTIGEDQALFLVPRAVNFTLLIFIVYTGLNLIWRIPDSSSWFLLIGIIGHGFISTAILLACFDYFSKMRLWREQLQTEIKG